MFGKTAQSSGITAQSSSLAELLSSKVKESLCRGIESSRASEFGVQFEPEFFLLGCQDPCSRGLSDLMTDPMTDPGTDPGTDPYSYYFLLCLIAGSQQSTLSY
jgi:hypothetical protein